MSLRALGDGELFRLSVPMRYQAAGAQAALFLAYAGVILGGGTAAGAPPAAAVLTAVGLYAGARITCGLAPTVRQPWLEWARRRAAPLDFLVIGVALVPLGEPTAPLWAAFFAALVGHAGRYHGRGFAALAALAVGCAAVSSALAGLAGGQGLSLGAPATIAAITAAMAGMTGAVAAEWRAAERRALALAETDPLTGIANRRAFVERLDHLARDPRAPFSVLMVDLDNFKTVNDLFGHQRGDSVLAQVARVLEANLRDGDGVARYGGEEFVVAMPGAGLADAALVAERMRRVVQDQGVTTVSIGCAARNPGEEPLSVVNRADALLLAAKRGGRNTVRATPETLRRSA